MSSKQGLRTRQIFKYEALRYSSNVPILPAMRKLRVGCTLLHIIMAWPRPHYGIDHDDNTLRVPTDAY